MSLLLVVIIFIGCSNNLQDLQKDITISSTFKNVMIDSTTIPYSVCEPSICISPLDQNIIVGGSVLDNVYLSSDGGTTWTKDKLTSSHGVFGDPVIRADFKGNFYFSHLSNPTGRAYQDDEFLDRIVVQKSTDNGTSWNDGSYTKPSTTKDHDKQWMAVDPNNNNLYMTWTEFDKYGSKEAKDKSRILFSRSIDGSTSWSDPITISDLEGDCVDDDDTTEGAVPAVGPAGEVYVTWAYDEKLFFDKSTDGGLTWGNDLIIADQPGGWTIDVPGIPRCNGMPITEVDLSQGPYQGNIYVNWGDQRNGADDTDIWITKSIDGGGNWSTPKRVNDDLAGKHQFLSWMDVDPSTGYIYIVFYDRRAYEDNATDVYLAYSTDAAETFTNVKISKESFTPTIGGFFGDYNDISAYNGTIRPIWTRLDGYVQSVWTALIEVK